MWIPAYDKIEIEEWTNDAVIFTCVCGKNMAVETGNGEYVCACGRAYQQSLSFMMREAANTEEYLERLNEAVDCFGETVRVFREAVDKLEESYGARSS